MARTVKPFTKVIPLKQRTVTIFDPSEAGLVGDAAPTFACTDDEKIDMLLDAALPLYVTWPGTIEQHVFEISTTAERREALKILLG